jgi:hypothetical protein
MPEDQVIASTSPYRAGGVRTAEPARHPRNARDAVMIGGGDDEVAVVMRQP